MLHAYTSSDDGGGARFDPWEIYKALNVSVETKGLSGRGLFEIRVPSSLDYG